MQLQVLNIIQTNAVCMAADHFLEDIETQVMLGKRDEQELIDMGIAVSIALELWAVSSQKRYLWYLYTKVDNDS
jgi:hypothetical protein